MMTEFDKIGRIMDTMRGWIVVLVRASPCELLPYGGHLFLPTHPVTLYPLCPAGWILLCCPHAPWGLTIGIEHLLPTPLTFWSSCILHLLNACDVWGAPLTRVLLRFLPPAELVYSHGRAPVWLCRVFSTGTAGAVDLALPWGFYACLLHPMVRPLASLVHNFALSLPPVLLRMVANCVEFHDTVLPSARYASLTHPSSLVSQAALESCPARSLSSSCERPQTVETVDCRQSVLPPLFRHRCAVFNLCSMWPPSGRIFPPPRVLHRAAFLAPSRAFLGPGPYAPSLCFCLSHYPS